MFELLDFWGSFPMESDSSHPQSRVLKILVRFPLKNCLCRCGTLWLRAFVACKHLSMHNAVSERWLMTPQFSRLTYKQALPARTVLLLRLRLASIPCCLRRNRCLVNYKLRQRNLDRPLARALAYCPISPSSTTGVYWTIIHCFFVLQGKMR